MLRGAVVGCGGRGRTHLSAWSRVRTVRLEAVADLDVSVASRAARDFYVPRSYPGLDELLAREKLDFVDLAVGVDGQATLVRKCLENGANVLASSPPATGMDAAREMVDLAESKGLVLMIGYTRRWHAALRELKRSADGGAAGALHYASIFDRRPLARTRPVDPTRPGLEKLQHLLVLEGLLDYVDLVRFLFGEIKSVWAATLKINPAVRGEDFALAAVRTVGDAPVNVVLDVNWSSPLAGRAGRAGSYPRFRLEGELGALELDPDAGVLRSRGHGGRLQETPLPPVPDLRLEPHLELQGHFAECLESGRRPDCSGEDALRSLEAALAIYDSDRSGGLVLIKKP